MVRAIGFAKRRVRQFSPLAGGVGLAVACSTTSHDFGGPRDSVTGTAGNDTSESDGGEGATVSNGGAAGDTSSNSGNSGSNSASAGEGGAAPIENGAPVVVSVSLEDASDSAQPGVSVKITFNEALQADTVTLDSVKLYDGDTEVEGEVRYAGKVVTFTPVASLSLLASYRVSLSTAITDLSGTPLKKVFNASFQVRDGVWSATRTDLSPDDSAVTQVSAAADGKGNILFAWVEAGPPLNVSARWYHSGIGWDPKVQNLDSGTVGSPTVAVSPEGDAVVVWISGSSYMAKRCLATKWQGTPKKLGTVTTTPKAPVASVRKGRLLAAWPVGIDNGAHFNWAVHANTASGEGDWQAAPTPVWTTTVDNLSVRDPSLKQDANGDGFLVFELAKTSFRQLFSATFADSGAIWSPAAAIDGTTALVTDTGQGYSLAVTDAGRAGRLGAESPADGRLRRRRQGLGRRQAAE
jgi:hypothetical protein